MNWYKFILKILPDGKAFRAIEYSKILWEVFANGLQMVLDYGVFTINDQVWYVNDNFDPEPWEQRYSIIVPEGSTIEERSEVVKQYMMYPKSANRLSRDYLQSILDDAGFTSLLVEYNSSGNSFDYLRANDFENEKNIFNLGALTYNSFTVSGTLNSIYYKNAISLLMEAKPLQVAMWDKISIDYALAIDDDFVLALDDDYALVISTNVEATVIDNGIDDVLQSDVEIIDSGIDDVLENDTGIIDGGLDSIF
jgi:hypothetical protein